MNKKNVLTCTGGGGSLSTGFNMAEILLSLTIIGVVAAITLPSLTGNINERTWNTQRKALYARFSQAIALMPALNGYGTDNPDTAAETFVTAGLSKVLKINNICDSEHLTDCGLNEKLTTLNATSLALPNKLTDLNSGLLYHGGMSDTKAAAFETVNGESILAFYNPTCTQGNVMYQSTDVAGTPGFIVKQHVCANFVYDLNGSKGPNTVGKDIGFISAVYPSDTAVVMPVVAKKLTGTYEQTLAGRACSDADKEFRLANIEELLSIYYNANLTGTTADSWSSSVVDSQNAWYFGFNNGMKYSIPRTLQRAVFCIKR